MQDAATRLDDSALKLKELENLVTSDHDNIRDERKQAEVLRNKQIQGMYFVLYILFMRYTASIAHIIDKIQGKYYVYY